MRPEASRACPPILVAAALIAGLSAEAYAQASPRWIVRLEAGTAEIHRPESDGWLAGAALSRRTGSDHARLEVDASAGSADEGFVMVAGALDLRLLGRGPITPVGSLRLDSSRSRSSGASSRTSAPVF